MLFTFESHRGPRLMRAVGFNRWFAAELVQIIEKYRLNLLRLQLGMIHHRRTHTISEFAIQHLLVSDAAIVMHSGWGIAKAVEHPSNVRLSLISVPCVPLPASQKRCVR